MKLVVSTPTALVADVDNLTEVRAEDRTGAFGIRPGHAEFVTILPVSVTTWRDAGGREGFVLVRRGVLTVREGRRVEIAARGAWSESDLEKLGPGALEALRQSEDVEDVTRTSEARLHLATMRQIERVLSARRSGRTSAPSLKPGGAEREQAR